MANQKAPRQANIELLRVVSMLAVIAMHFLGVGGVMTRSPGVWFAVSSTFYSFAIAATSCYVIENICGSNIQAVSKFLAVLNNSKGNHSDVVFVKNFLLLITPFTKSKIYAII